MDSGKEVLTSGAIIEFTVGNLITPLTTLSSDSLMIFVFDEEARMINYVMKELFITMLKGKLIDDITVSSSSQIVGSEASHFVKFKTPLDIETDD